MPSGLITVILVSLALAWLGFGTLAAVHAVTFKRDPKGAALWAILSFSFPIFGPWLYWGFGINRIERRALKRRAGRQFPVPTPDHAACSVQPLSTDMAIGRLAPLYTVAHRVTGLHLLAGNTVTPLHNGEQAYPQMLDAITSAEKSVTLTSYIFDWDEVGRHFADALRAAAQRGVRVHVLVDGIGAVKSFSRMGRFLIKGGAQVAAFFPLRFPFGRLRLNLRNHRKILVIDGHTAFTGGLNISRRYLFRLASRDRTEDLHFKITGPVVAQMQHAFADDWLLAVDKTLTGDAYFPKPRNTGSALCRGISSGPDQDLEKIHWIMQAAFASAQRSVRVVTPYFVPSLQLLSAMSLAALRGVEVSLFLPSVVDVPYLRWVADAYLWQVLQHGIRVYRRPPPFVHTKLMIVDEQWLLFGSANLDRRSFRLNFEFNIEAYDPPLAADLSAWLDRLVPESERVTMVRMDSRPLIRRFRDGLAKLMSPYL